MEGQGTLRLALEGKGPSNSSAFPAFPGGPGIWAGQSLPGRSPLLSLIVKVTFGISVSRASTRPPRHGGLRWSGLKNPEDGKTDPEAG
jgi:hypothetical protein